MQAKKLLKIKLPLRAQLLQKAQPPLLPQVLLLARPLLKKHLRQPKLLRSLQNRLNNLKWVVFPL
jgi:hypothetical protein